MNRFQGAKDVTTSSPGVSIVIRTFNTGKYIGQILKSLAAQKSCKVQIVVVDSGSTDCTLSVAASFQNVKIVRIGTQQFTYGRALNEGIRHCIFPFIALLSHDAIPTTHTWLWRLIGHLKDPQVAGVYGRQLAYLHAWPLVRREYLKTWTVDPRVQTNSEDCRDHFFSNANAVIRQKCWEEHPFNESLPACEDWEWVRAMLQRGYKIVYEPEAEVYHSHNYSLLEVFRRAYSEALAGRLLYPGREMTAGTALRGWQNMILDDIRYIRQTGEDIKWLLWSPIYRFFWTYGWLRPDMPAALWKPFAQRWKRLWAK